METARIATKDALGLQLTAFIRNLLLADCGCDWDHAQKVAAVVQDRIEEADWVSLDNGTTLTATFDASKARRRQLEEAQDKLEAMVDAVGIDTLLDRLVLVCHEKGAHLESNWQDTAAAREWSKAGTMIDCCRVKLGEEVSL